MAASKKQVSTDGLGLYQWIANDLQRLRNELLKEMRYSSVQVGSLYQEMKADKETSSSAISQEIRYSYKQNQTIYDGLATMLTNEVGNRLNSVDEKLTALEQLQTLLNEVREVKYGYQQLQAIYESLTAQISDEVVAKIGELEEKANLLEQIEKTLQEINAKLFDSQEEYAKLANSINSGTEECVSAYSQQIIDAVSDANVVDYNRIVDEVGDKVMDILGELKASKEEEPVPEQEKIDYDRIIYGAAEKVVESLPLPEKVDYNRIDESIAKAVSAIAIPEIDDEKLADVVAAKVVVPEIDYDKLADVVAAKVVVPEIDYDKLADVVAAKVVVPEIDYDKLADVVAAKVVVPEIDYDKLADVVLAKMSENTQQSYDVVLDEEGLAQVAEKVAEKLSDSAEKVNYQRIEEIVGASEAVVGEKLNSIEEKLSACDEEEATYDLVLDEEGINAIAKGVSEEICRACATCEIATAEEVEVAEAVEEPAEEKVEEVVEESVEEPAEEPVAEEAVEEVIEEAAETPAEEELAVAVARVEEPIDMEELNNQLIDAETGLVIRLKKSFTAKIRQSEEVIKGYYSDIKNELTSYKKINSSVSWHGDRFNFGRNTVAKINICGKTLCFYLALDPNDAEYKSTIYHQKDVGNQKAYESTPFMVKVKSDVAAKKALRLVGYLAEKLGAEKNEKFQPVDYVEQFSYQSTKKLYDDGFIKATKEKKVDLNF